MKSEQLTDAQSYQVTLIQNAAYEAVRTTTANIMEKEPNWNIEWIGEVADCIANVAERYFGLPEKLVYPYIEDEAEDENI